MKREIKSKRCVLDQDKSIVRELIDMIDDDKFVTKEEKNFVIDLTEDNEINENIEEGFLV